MNKQRGITVLFASAALALLVSLPAAAQLPEGFRARNIGDGQGSTTVTDGKWTVKGQGADLWGADNDHFHFVAKEHTGDGSITARMLASTPGHDDGWQKNGAMIRENDTQGSPHATVEMTNRGASGLYFHWRAEQDGESADRSGFTDRRFPILMRVQRSGNEFAGYYSRDGVLWSYMSSATVTMGEKAHYGLGVMSHDADNADTVDFDSVAVAPGATSVYGLQACSNENGVLLSWAPLKGAQSYRVLRGPANVGIEAAKLEQLQSISADAVTQASFTDTSDALAPGARHVYAVQAIIDGKEGPLVAAVAGKRGPVQAPAGFTFSVVGDNKEGECALGSVGVTMDEAGVITMRGGGHDIWDDGDDFTFLHQKISGNARVTVTMLNAPSATSSWSKAGPMVRDTTARGSRHGFYAITGFEGIVAQFRPEADGASESIDRSMEWADVGANLLKGPITLRLTRQGDTLTHEYSLDGGATFQSGGDPLTVSLNNDIEIGVALTSHQTDRISEVKFRDVKIEKL